jgi:cystathionine beta-lyase family protein involved in aluminum resistance
MWLRSNHEKGTRDVSKRQERQRFIRHYKDVTGEREIDMHKVAAFAKAKGWKMPTPPSDVDMLAKLFADDAQAERKYDAKTKKPYRVYHALPASG